MAVFGPFTKGFLSIGGNDISNTVRSMAVAYEADAVESAAMGDETQINLGGVKNWSISATLKQDFANVDSTAGANLFALVGSSTLSVAFRAHSTQAVGSSNPQFTGTGMLQSYPPIDGAHGDLLEIDISILSASALSRSTST